MRRVEKWRWEGSQCRSRRGEGECRGRERGLSDKSMVGGQRGVGIRQAD